MIYFAYGSNLNVDHMARRCPKAEPLGKFYLGDARLVFRGVADCIHEPGAKCAGALWRITDECEDALDRYEGVGAGMYRKVYCELTGATGGEEWLMLYRMNSTGIFPPSSSYLQTIRQGYKDFKLPVRYLREAVDASWEDKNPSHVERQRHRKNGRPALARIKPAKAGTGKPTTGNLFGTLTKEYR